jgi:hypothetical protein
LGNSRDQHGRTQWVVHIVAGLKKNCPRNLLLVCFHGPSRGRCPNDNHSSIHSTLAHISSWPIPPVRPSAQQTKTRLRVAQSLPRHFCACIVSLAGGSQSSRSRHDLLHSCTFVPAQGSNDPRRAKLGSRQATSGQHVAPAIPVDESGLP